MSSSDLLRAQLSSFMDFDEAHASSDAAMAELDFALQGKRPPHVPHSAWELLEHLRITQHDILDFSTNPGYEARKWPEGYWPESPAPPAADSWKKSVASFRADRKALRAMAEDSKVDLTARLPHGDGQTYFRELLLAQDHLSYHLGQLVLVRRLLGAWHPEK